MSLPVQQTRGIFYKAYLAAFKEVIPVPSFLRSFFSVTTTAAKTVAFEIQRNTERIGSDVLRGVDGNRNTFSNSTEKEFMPPFYNENFDATTLDRYDRVFGQNVTDTPPEQIGYLAKDVNEKLQELRKKIERAKENQCAQIFNTGVVTLLNGDNLDFKRKATSLVDLNAGTAGGYWSTDTTDVEAQLIAGAEFIRNNGKNGEPEFNLVMSGAAWVELKQTNYFKDVANFKQVLLVDIKMPQTTAFGAGFHGQIVAGAYIFNVWTYDQVYEAADGGAITRYFPSNKAVITPVRGTSFELAHAGIPAIIRDTQKAEFSQFITQISSEYFVNNYIDEKAKSHTFEVLSAALAIPKSVDMIYTMQVLGTSNPFVG